MSIQWPEPEHAKESAGAACGPAGTPWWFAARRKPDAVLEDAELEAGS